MTEATAAAANTETKKFPFSPIFVATVTPGAIERGMGKNNAPYAKMQNSKVQQGEKEALERTVMAFGNQLAEVESSLVEGQPVDLAVQFDGGSVKIIGFPREKTEAANG